MGRPPQPGVVITTASLRGVTLYEPSELVMSARAGTPLLEIEAELAANGQMLAFEPMDLGPATGGPAGAQTIGGVFATNLSGSRRISAGAARDQLLGAVAVNGRGELFKSGGRVMKNVTGYDVARGLTGSWGTLAVMTEVTFKVLPLPEVGRDACLYRAARRSRGRASDHGHGHRPSMSAARRTCPSALPRGFLTRASRTMGEVVHRHQAGELRSVRHRAQRQSSKRRSKSTATRSNSGLTNRYALWTDLRHLNIMPYSRRYEPMAHLDDALQGAGDRRRDRKLHAGHGILRLVGRACVDGSSGRGGCGLSRRAAGGCGARRTCHACARGADVRQSVDIFEPMKPEIDRLTRGLKSAFDPLNLLNPGRMYAHI